jgi:hypothetical protein
MKIKSLDGASLVIGLLIWGIPGVTAGQLKVQALLFGHEPDPFSQVSFEPSIKIKVFDSQGDPVKNAIVLDRSGLVDASKWQVEWAGQQKLESFTVSRIQHFPSQGSAATEIVAKLPADLGVASIDEPAWRLVISGSDASPALVLREGDGNVTTLASLELEVQPAGADDPDLIERFMPVEPNLEFGGGGDGAVFSADFSFRSSARLTEDNQIYGLHGQFEGSFTPDPAESLLMYGRYSGEFGAFRTWGIPANPLSTGSLYFDLNSRFESDQETENYNFTGGTGVWGFLGFKPLTLFSKGLYGIVNAGRGEAMPEPPILTGYLGYDYVLDAEREPGTPATGENRIRSLVRYRTPLWRNLVGPLLPTAFDVDTVIDFSGIWDLDQDRMLPEFKSGFEFMPRSVSEGKLAFTINYVSGNISPTFVDEDAFLAGLKLRF